MVKIIKIIHIIVVTLLPIAELRGGIPLAIALGLNPFLAYTICVVTNIAVVPIVYFFLENIHLFMISFPWYKKTFDRFLQRTRQKVEPKIKKWGYLGLALFVAVPLPVTGAYTATLGAWFFGMNKKISLVAIAFGVLISGIVVTLVTIGGMTMLKFFS